MKAYMQTNADTTGGGNDSEQDSSVWSFIAWFWYYPAITTSPGRTTMTPVCVCVCVCTQVWLPHRRTSGCPPRITSVPVRDGGRVCVTVLANCHGRLQ